jgi:hypothetical protein
VVESVASTALGKVMLVLCAEQVLACKQLVAPPSTQQFDPRSSDCCLGLSDKGRRSLTRAWAKHIATQGKPGQQHGDSDTGQAWSAAWAACRCSSGV